MALGEYLSIVGLLFPRGENRNANAGRWYKPIGDRLQQCRPGPGLEAPPPGAGGAQGPSFVDEGDPQAQRTEESLYPW